MGKRDGLKAALASTTLPWQLPVARRRPILEFEMEIHNIDPAVVDLLFYGGPNPNIILGEN